MNFHPNQLALMEACGVDRAKQKQAHTLLGLLGYTGEGPFSDRMWAGIIRASTAMGSDHIIAWSRRHQIGLQPLALLVEAHSDPFNRTPDRMMPDRLEFLFETLRNDLWDDTANVLTLVDAESYAVMIPGRKPRHV